MYLEQLWRLFLEFFHLPFVLAGVERGWRSRAGAFTVGSGTHRLHRVKILHAHTSSPQASARVPGQRPHDALTAAVGSLWCHADLFLPKDLKRKLIESDGNYIVCCDSMTYFSVISATLQNYVHFSSLQRHTNQPETWVYWSVLKPELSSWHQIWKFEVRRSPVPHDRIQPHVPQWPMTFSPYKFPVSIITQLLKCH